MPVAPPHVSLAVETVTPEIIIARLQRELRADPRQRAVAPARLDATIAQTVRELWDQSRVKTFVPLLAMRETRERLARAAVAAARPNADGLDLTNDEVIGLDDDVLDAD